MDNAKPTYQELLIENENLKKLLSEKGIFENALKESEEKYKSMVSISPDGVIIHQNGKIVFANDAAIKIMKAKDENELIGKIAIEFVHPDCRELALARIKKSFTEKTSAQTVEEIFIDLEGNSINVYVTAIPFLYNGIASMLTVITDISPLKKIEKELILAKEKAEETETIFKHFIKNSPIYVFFKDSEIRPIYLSDNYEKMLGMPIGNLIGKSMFELFPSDLAKNMVEDDKKILNEGKTIEIEEELNGRIYETIKFPIYINEIPKFLAGFTMEITDRKKAENLLKEKNEELIKAKEKAEESDRLKTAFLQNMSHEIRTPMNAIIGFSSFLADPDLSGEKRNNFISIINNSTNQLLSIVTNILTISSIDTKQETINKNKVSINNLFFELLTIFRTQARNKNVSLICKQIQNDQILDIYTDKTKITQILTNLIANSLKFTPHGTIEFGYNIKNDFIEFFVKDTGIGIKSEFQKIIFERFNQAEASISKKYGGTGLGLAISKGFVELLGGKIWVESEENSGATFYFSIPYSPLQEVNISTPTIKKNENSKTILIAEDEEYNYFLLEQLLKNYNFTIIHSRNGIETIEICKSNPNIDLILMDIKMPIMDGLEAAKQIKKFNPNLPIIAQSAFALEHEKEKYKDSAFDEYITKPINKDELFQKIMNFITNN